jgi:hypothetical protein
MLRKDGKRKIPKVHRISNPELRAIDLAYAMRHPAESYQKLADEAGVDRFTMRERIRRVRGRQGGRGPARAADGREGAVRRVRPERALPVTKVRQDGMPRVRNLRRIMNPALFWEDLCYARRWPEESYGELAAEAGVLRATMILRIRRVLAVVTGTAYDRAANDRMGHLQRRKDRHQDRVGNQESRRRELAAVRRVRVRERQLLGRRDRAAVDAAPRPPQS